MTNRGLQIQLTFITAKSFTLPARLALLDCRNELRLEPSALAIPLFPSSNGDHLRRASLIPLEVDAEESVIKGNKETVFLTEPKPYDGALSWRYKLLLSCQPSDYYPFELLQTFPRSTWSSERRFFGMDENTNRAGLLFGNAGFGFWALIVDLNMFLGTPRPRCELKRTDTSSPATLADHVLGCSDPDAEQSSKLEVSGYDGGWMVRMSVNAELVPINDSSVGIIIRVVRSA